MPFSRLRQSAAIHGVESSPRSVRFYMVPTNRYGGKHDRVEHNQDFQQDEYGEAMNRGGMEDSDVDAMSMGMSRMDMSETSMASLAWGTSSTPGRFIELDLGQMTTSRSFDEYEDENDDDDDDDDEEFFDCDEDDETLRTGRPSMIVPILPKMALLPAGSADPMRCYSRRDRRKAMGHMMKRESARRLSSGSLGSIGGSSRRRSDLSEKSATR